MEKFNMHARLPPNWRTLLPALMLILLLLVTAGCSSLRFAYNHSDTAIYWWLNTYLDFDSEQRGWVKKDIDNLLLWHRKTQLHDYVQLLQTGQRQLASPTITQADLLGNFQDIKSRSQLLLIKALPELADMARAVKPEQIAHMEKKFNTNNEDFRKKFIRVDHEKRQKMRFQKSMEQFESWFGNFSREQEAVLRKLSDARPQDDQIWLDERILRQKKIVALLNQVHQEKLSKDATISQIQSLVKQFYDRYDAPERKAFYDAYFAQTANLALTVIKISTPAQKAHAHKRMQGWIDDFSVLAAEPK